MHLYHLAQLLIILSLNIVPVLVSDLRLFKKNKYGSMYSNIVFLECVSALAGKVERLILTLCPSGATRHVDYCFASGPYTHGDLI